MSNDEALPNGIEPPAQEQVTGQSMEELNSQVTEQIMAAEQLDDAGASEDERSQAWSIVSRTEESIADSATNAIEREIGQRGAIAAAVKSGDSNRAEQLRIKFGGLEINRATGEVFADPSLLNKYAEAFGDKKAESPDDLGVISRSVLALASRNLEQRAGMWAPEVILAVGKELGYEHAAIAAVFLELVDQGVIEYDPNNDANGNGIVLTEAGRNLFEHYDELMPTLPESIPPPADPRRGKDVFKEAGFQVPVADPDTEAAIMRNAREEPMILIFTETDLATGAIRYSARKGGRVVYEWRERPDEVTSVEEGEQ